MSHKYSEDKRDVKSPTRYGCVTNPFHHNILGNVLVSQVNLESFNAKSN